MSQEVKVGQTWVGRISGLKGLVAAVGDGFATMACVNGEIVKVKIGREFFFAYEILSDQRGENNSDGSISIRDHFAGLAMQAMVLEAVSEEIKNGNCEAVKAMTNAAYMVADEMIKARGE